jgi:hypothetical protein
MPVCVDAHAGPRQVVLLAHVGGCMWWILRRERDAEFLHTFREQVPSKLHRSSSCVR